MLHDSFRWAYIPAPGDSNFPSWLMHTHAGVEYCYDGSIPKNHICADGLDPESGYAIVQESLLIQYPVYGIILVLIPWECPVFAAALIFYCFTSKKHFKLIEPL
ncbi:MAG: hypothetical protein WBF33_07705 [Candidatus Nitrosopolaris sp.]